MKQAVKVKPLFIIIIVAVVALVGNFVFSGILATKVLNSPANEVTKETVVVPDDVAQASMRDIKEIVMEVVRDDDAKKNLVEAVSSELEKAQGIIDEDEISRIATSVTENLNTTYALNETQTNQVEKMLKQALNKASDDIASKIDVSKLTVNTKSDVTAADVNKQVSAVKTELENKIASLAVDTLKQQVEANKAAYDKAITENNTKIANLNTKMETQATSIQALSTQLNNVAAQIKESDPALSAKVTQLASDLSTLSTNYQATASATNTALQDLQTKVSTNSAGVAALNSTVTALTNTVNTANTKVEAMESTVNTLSSSLATANGKISVLETSVGSLNSALTTANNKISGLESSVAAVNNAIAPAYDSTKVYHDGDIVMKDGRLQKYVASSGTWQDNIDSLVEQMASNAAAIEAALNGMASLEYVNATFATKASLDGLSSVYLSKTDAANTYLTQANASSTYLSQTDAYNTYATLETLTDNLALKADQTDVDALNSRLTRQGIPVACEVDVYGALSEYIGQSISGSSVTILNINNNIPKLLFNTVKDQKGRFAMNQPFKSAMLSH